ncbi:MAG: diacylglycerol kinase family protein [bacterium]
MHVYIYDSYVSQKKFENQVAKIETRITDLGLNGKIVRLGIMNSVYNIVENELKKTVKTITAVGSNNILNQIVNAIAKLSSLNELSHDIPLGFIPVGKKDNSIAEFLGIKPEEEACDTLSSRRIEQLDLGRVNNHYFLTEATIPTNGTTIEIDENYSIEIMEKGDIYVVNIPVEASFPHGVKHDAKDGELELFINSGNGLNFFPGAQKNQSKSVFSFNKLNIINKNKPIILDGSIKIDAPAEISIAKEKINMIVGKDRKI